MKKEFSLWTFRIYSLYFPTYHTAVISNWHSSFTSTKIRSGAAAAADLQHPLEKVRVKNRNEALSGKNWQNRSSDRSWFSEPNSCISSYLEKRKNTSWFFPSSFILHCCSRLEVTFMRPAETCCKNMCFSCMYSPITKSTYLLTFPTTLLEQFLRSIWNTVSRVIVLILPQIKLNSKLCYAFFFLSQPHHVHLLFFFSLLFKWHLLLSHLSQGRESGLRTCEHAVVTSTEPPFMNKGYECLGHHCVLST